jgi:hypothetical protein
MYACQYVISYSFGKGHNSSVSLQSFKSLLQVECSCLMMCTSQRLQSKQRKEGNSVNYTNIQHTFQSQGFLTLAELLLLKYLFTIMCVRIMWTLHWKHITACASLILQMQVIKNSYIFRAWCISLLNRNVETSYFDLFTFCCTLVLELSIKRAQLENLYLSIHSSAFSLGIQCLTIFFYPETEFHALSLVTSGTGTPELPIYIYIYISHRPHIYMSNMNCNTVQLNQLGLPILWPQSATGTVISCISHCHHYCCITHVYHKCGVINFWP